MFADFNRAVFIGQVTYVKGLSVILGLILETIQVFCDNESVVDDIRYSQHGRKYCKWTHSLSGTFNVYTLFLLLSVARKPYPGSRFAERKGIGNRASEEKNR